MKIDLESNFKLLGSHNIDSVELKASEIALKDFLRIMSDRSAKSPEYINSDGTGLDKFFQIQINGRVLNLYENGINSVLKDGDTVAIYSNAHDG
jgi:hypothetical protein